LVEELPLEAVLSPTFRSFDGPHFAGFAPLALLTGFGHLGAGGAGFSRLRLAFSAIALDTSPGRRLVFGIKTVDPARILIPLGMPLTSLNVSTSTPRVLAA
jgi:hypothetical protein